MIQIVLKSGQIVVNDPKLGFNSNSVKAILESLKEFGSYHYCYKGGSIDIPKEEIVEVREV